MVKVAEQAPRGRLPSPPEVEGDFAQRLERCRQSRNYIINLERRHAAKWKLAKNGRVGKFLRHLVHKARQIAADIRPPRSERVMLQQLSPAGGKGTSRRQIRLSIRTNAPMCLLAASKGRTRSGLQ